LLTLQDYGKSTFHILKSDELWTFVHGDPLTVYVINKDTAELETRNLGPEENNRFFTIVPHGKFEVE